jgi:beta-xylosidase
VALVYDGDFPDPCLIGYRGRYYAYATNRMGVNVQVMTAADPMGPWEHLGDALPRLPSWAQPGFTWAPAVIRQGDGFLLYYTVREPTSGRQGISVAESPRPGGPFLDRSSRPLILQLDHGGSIDPYPLVDGDGTRYLLWKSDDNAIGRRSALWSHELDAAGATQIGPAHRLLAQDRRWETPLIEAPAMIVSGRIYFLFYSANWWESDRYAIGYAHARHPLGPFTKVTKTGPWKASSPGEAGPGGQDFWPHPDGGFWMAYHAWSPERVGYGNGGVRSLRVARVEIIDGVPHQSL